MTTPEIIDQIHELILEDRRISAKSIVEQLGISRERVGSIIPEDLDMLVACFLPGRGKDLSAPLYIGRPNCHSNLVSHFSRRSDVVFHDIFIFFAV